MPIWISPAQLLSTSTRTGPHICEVLARIRMQEHGTLHAEKALPRKAKRGKPATGGLEGTRNETEAGVQADGKGKKK